MTWHLCSCRLFCQLAQFFKILYKELSVEASCVQVKGQELGHLAVDKMSSQRNDMAPL